MGSERRRPLPPVEGTVEHGVATDGAEPEHLSVTNDQIATVSVLEIPEPYEQPDADGELNEQEKRDLTACEAALDVLRVAFWRAGKALRVINAARLWRETHDTFESYVVDRWQIQTAQAYRLINASAVAEPIALSPMGDKVNERQVRELLPVATAHGHQAAVTLYMTLAHNAASRRITADLIKAVVAALPDGEWSEDNANEAVRAVLNPIDDTATTDDPGNGGSDTNERPWFDAEGTRLATLADKVARRAPKHPDEARAFAAQLIAYARRIEDALTTTQHR